MNLRRMGFSPLRHVLPKLETEEDLLRFSCLDIPRLSTEGIAAETRVLEHALAAAIFSKTRPTHLHVDARGGTVTDIDWVRARLAALRAALQHPRKRHAA
jgi:hypothetical protein